jgi:hypothetical protein
MEILKQYPVLDTDEVLGAVGPLGADVIGGQLDAQHLAAVHHDRAPLAGSTTAPGATDKLARD